MRERKFNFIWKTISIKMILILMNKNKSSKQQLMSSSCLKLMILDRNLWHMRKWQREIPDSKASIRTSLKSSKTIKNITSQKRQMERNQQAVSKIFNLLQLPKVFTIPIDHPVNLSLRIYQRVRFHRIPEGIMLSINQDKGWNMFLSWDPNPWNQLWWVHSSHFWGSLGSTIFQMSKSSWSWSERSNKT